MAVPNFGVFYPYILGGFCKREFFKFPKFQNGLQEKTGFNISLL